MTTANSPNPRTCRCSRANVLAETVDYEWPRGTELTWSNQAYLPTLSDDQVDAEIAAGLAPWAAACGVAFRRVIDPDQARLLIVSGSVDGQWNILAETELPTERRADVRHRMTLDVAEAWTIGFLWKVVMHEAGHFLGLGHAPDGVEAVMDAIYQEPLETLQPWDVAQAVERYGPPLSELASGPIYLAFPAPGTYVVTIAPAIADPHNPPFSYQQVLTSPGTYRVVFEPLPDGQPST